MQFRISTTLRQPIVLALMVLLPFITLYSQEMIGGKLIRSGLWKGNVIEYVEGDIFVILKPGVTKSAVLPVAQRHGATISEDFDPLGWGMLELPDTVDVLSLAAELSKHPLIKSAEPNMVTRAHYAPNDTFYVDGTARAQGRGDDIGQS